MKQRLAVISAVLFVWVLGVWGYAINTRVAKLEAVEAVDASVHAETPPTITTFGASASGCQGIQPIGENTRIVCAAFDETRVAPDAGTLLGCLNTAPTNGSHWDITEIVSLDYSGTSDCDAGNCIADIRTYFPGTLRGGKFCRGDSVCLTVPVLDSFEPATGPMAGASAPLVFTDAGTICADIQCAQGCWARGTLSAIGGHVPDAGGF